MSSTRFQKFPVDDLLLWYDRHGRQLPWRQYWPKLADPYHVWLSEIMLQQTVVKTAIPYFMKFIERWPTIHSLGSVQVTEVLSAWAGLGYYARARNLHRTAGLVSTVWDGSFPKNFPDLLMLPGIGKYTAGAILAIAYGRQVVVVDGNIERLLARFFAIEKSFPSAKHDVAAAYQTILPVQRPSDFPQALMDFANALCSPMRPSCDVCPLSQSCEAYKKKLVSVLSSTINSLRMFRSCLR